MVASKAQQKATAKYQKANYDLVNLRLPKGTKERIQKTGKSVNGFITEATIEKLEKDKASEEN